ncbi:EF-hand calcium-binding domain-containing protein 1-like isoform X1 [Xenia sp. Carnegie-2017]|uniref:EF-hand calcium-binding domain-containing protein 1-like isoform X1 n=1 Tax=Xenia sp. Carnegie-2017 TaxID=2897299 RepID=UPI001F04D052|nr:EF-hand calcium-binding domain-containing protein 1-like isoform X1 [Xenia sp. Carnegie-2017]
MTSLTVKKNQAKIAEGIYKQTHFTKTEVENLLMIFRERANQKEKLDRTKFRDILHNTFGMTDDFLMDGVFRAFDKDNDSNINMEEWILGLSVFLRGTMEEKMHYCFEVYDLNSDGYISREEIFQMLKSSLIKQPTEEDPDEGVKELVEIVLKLVDHGNVGKLSFKDFEMVVNKEPLLLEAFGPCLPDAKAIDDFNTQFTDTT